MDVTNVSNVLVVSNFICELSFASLIQREASFVINEGANYSGIIKRSLSNAKAIDYGIGLVVSIFEVSTVFGSKTYILISPNPSKDYINIVISKDEVYLSTLFIYNILGQQKLEINNINEVNRVDLSEFDNGIYFVELQYQNKLVRKKFVKYK